MLAEGARGQMGTGAAVRVQTVHDATALAAVLISPTARILTYFLPRANS